MRKSPKIHAAIFLFMAYSSTGLAQEMSHDQIQKLNELESCLKLLPKSGDGPVDSKCAETPVDALHGVSSGDILRSLGNPSWCSKPQQTYVSWTEQDCGGTQEWGYSFYYLPSSYLGGGSELQFTFDKNHLVKIVSWVASE
ncbi:MAG: hypothetical protein V4812_18525 [Pseudomonadota bacterium]